MPYSAEKPQLAESSDQLRARIPGWGADLDPADRPAVPRERFDPAASGARWEFPERQEEVLPRERSIEHLQLTPVFGTSTPPKGVSGVVRRFAYAHYSEARAVHWLLLLGADRVDAWEQHLRTLLTLRPDNPVTETGVLAELPGHGIRSRRGTRADRRHQALDPLVVAAPWILGGVVVSLLGLSILRRLNSPRRPAPRA